MKKAYHYWKSCVDLHGSEVELLADMVEAETKVTLTTLLSHCEGVREWAEDRGYARNRLSGLTLREDSLVRFYRSKWRGERCYFIRWSAIESIWLRS
jgi:hypothetical protein